MTEVKTVHKKSCDEMLSKREKKSIFKKRNAILIFSLLCYIQKDDEVREYNSLRSTSIFQF